MFLVWISWTKSRICFILVSISVILDCKSSFWFLSSLMICSETGSNLLVFPWIRFLLKDKWRCSTFFFRKPKSRKEKPTNIRFLPQCEASCIWDSVRPNFSVRFGSSVKSAVRWSSVRFGSSVKRGFTEPNRYRTFYYIDSMKLGN